MNYFAPLLIVAVGLSVRLRADVFSFSTGNVDGRIGMASRPSSTGKIEIEAADDFLLSSETLIDHATFTGLIPLGVPLSSIASLNIEIYRTFPNDSANPPSGNVPTRVSSPSDVAFLTRASGVPGDLTFGASVLNGSFTAANSVLNGIHKIPNQFTGGEGAVVGQEVSFNVSLTLPIDLPADHYFFIPQVQLVTGEFYWLSSVRPLVSPGTPFAPDLQAWIRDENLDPDWLRVGTDIVGGSPVPTFNGAFTVSGETVPEASTVVAGAMLGLCAIAARKRSREIK